VLVLIAVGCGRSGTARTPPVVIDSAPALDLGSDAAGDVAAVVDTGTSAASPSDGGPTESCGSALSFQIVAGAGIDPGSFCTYGCHAIERIVFTSGSTQVTADDIEYSDCVPLCDACGAFLPPCHSCIGINPFPSEGVSYGWDGSYWGRGTCGTQPCRGPRLCAPAGHYTGQFCAMRGSTVSGRCTPSQGIGSQDVACGVAELDLPSTATITVEIGP
jgi:hypothetical protein